MIIIREYWLLESFGIESGLITRSTNYGLNEMRSLLDRIKIQRPEIT
jgi:hypothetical protein